MSAVTDNASAAMHMEISQFANDTEGYHEGYHGRSNASGIVCRALRQMVDMLVRGRGAIHLPHRARNTSSTPDEESQVYTTPGTSIPFVDATALQLCVDAGETARSRRRNRSWLT